MKKKQLTSILLAGIMILGLCVPAFADGGTGGQSTNVEYTALNNESYLLTVPANMAPGDTDNVSLTGSWPSTRTMKVTADANVVLTNSINASDKKTLTISFNEITLAGNNNETVSATEEVSIQDITNANFGEWSGRFSYYVNGEGLSIEENTTISELAAMGLKFDEDTGLISQAGTMPKPQPTGNIIIPNYVMGQSVKGIADNGLKDCTELTGITLSDDIDYIGSNAFSGCLKLTNINIPSSLTNIKSGTFANTGLTSINIPATVITIGENAFKGFNTSKGIKIDGIPGSISGWPWGSDEHSTVWGYKQHVSSDELDKMGMRFDSSTGAIYLKYSEDSSTSYYHTLYIPETVDGHTVTTIPTGFAKGRLDFYCGVIFPRTITNIKYGCISDDTLIENFSLTIENADSLSPVFEKDERWGVIGDYNIIAFDNVSLHCHGQSEEAPEWMHGISKGKISVYYNENFVR